MGTVFDLVNRVILLSYIIFHQNNLKFVRNTLINNGYPLNLIYNSIRIRIKTIFATRSNIANHQTNKVDNEW